MLHNPKCCANCIHILAPKFEFYHKSKKYCVLWMLSDLNIMKFRNNLL